MRGTSIMRDKLEDIAVVIFGSVIVILLCVVCRLCGWEVDD